MFPFWFITKTNSVRPTVYLRNKVRQIDIGTNKYYSRKHLPPHKKGYGVIVYKKEKTLRQYLKELKQFSVSNKKNKKRLWWTILLKPGRKMVKFFQEQKDRDWVKSPLSKYIYGDFEFKLFITINQH